MDVGVLVMAVVMGVVEGLTEFLPVSSTGHLILAGHALGFTGDLADVFEVAIQSGAILAVVVLYWPRFLGLLKESGAGTFSGKRGVLLLVVTSAPALLAGLLLHGAIKRHLFNPTTVALGLVVGAVAIFILEALPLKTPTDSLDKLSIQQALRVGLAQCLALWPGMSRSACTILGGMGTGLNRRTAAEYSFFAAVPVIAAATAWDLLKGVRGGLLHAQDFPLFAVGTVISFLAAWAAIKVFINLVSRWSLRPFAVYRVVLAVLVLAFPAAFGK